MERKSWKRKFPSKEDEGDGSGKRKMEESKAIMYVKNFHFYGTNAIFHHQ